MKTLKVIPFIAILMSLAYFGFAQNSASESIKVSGECGMCKKKIEKAAKDAGATYAVWNKDTKVLDIKYSSQTNSGKIQQKIADAGYDTPKFKATDEAYNKLEQCCQYERESVNTEKKESTMQCEMKDGKCVNEAVCKDKGCCAGDAKCKDANCSSKSVAMNSNMKMGQKNTSDKMTMNCSDGKNCCDKKTGN